jgi:outer membrane protein
MNRVTWAGALAATALLADGAASAEEVSPPGGITVFGWYLSSARVGAGVEPDYLGSKDYRFAPSGAISFARKGSVSTWGAPDDGYSIGLVGNGVLSAGVVTRWVSGRGDDHELRGLDKIDGTVEAGGFVDLWPTEWLRVRGEVRHGIGGHDSWTGDLGADAVARMGSWVLSAGPRLSWADDRFTRTYFEVTPLEASRSPFGIQPFAAGGTFWSPGVLASAEYRLNRVWKVGVFGEYHRLTGDAADSPLVSNLGSKDQFGATISLRYSFIP